MIRHFLSQLAFLFLLFTAGIAAEAATITTSNFLDIRGAVFAPFPYLPFAYVSVGSIDVLKPPGSYSIGAPVYFTGDPNNPAGRSGFGFLDEKSPAVFNLSEPAAGFGVTFEHGIASSPAMLKAYDGPNATGNLIGMITSVPVPPPWSVENRPIDFVAVWTDVRKIRSFSIEGTDERREVAILGLAATIISVPEPSSFVLALCGLVGFATRRALRMRNANRWL
jgi:hypothetical protein